MGGGVYAYTVASAPAAAKGSRTCRRRRRQAGGQHNGRRRRAGAAAPPLPADGVLLQDGVGAGGGDGGVQHHHLRPRQVRWGSGKRGPTARQCTPAAANAANHPHLRQHAPKAHPLEKQTDK